MDVFQSAAEKVIKEQPFQNGPSEYDLIEISSNDSTEPHSSKRVVPVTELRRGTSEWIGPESTRPSLKLVKLDFEPAGRQKLYTAFKRTFSVDRIPTRSHRTFDHLAAYLRSRQRIERTGGYSAPNGQAELWAGRPG
jgi:hypothetical protein